MDEILLLLHEIKADLDLIKRRMSIKSPALDHDQDQDQSSDLELELFKKECEGLEIDLTGVDLRGAGRTIGYYLGNKWRIKNPKAYLEKSLGKFKAAGEAKKAGTSLTTLGYLDDELEAYLPLLNESVFRQVLEKQPELKKRWTDLNSVWQQSEKRLVLAYAKKYGVIQ